MSNSFMSLLKLHAPLPWTVEFEKVWRTRRINSKSLFTMAMVSLIGCVENKKSNYKNNYTLFLYITLIDLGSAVYCRRRTWSWLGWLDEWMGGRNGRAYAAAVILTTALVTNYPEPAAQWWRDRIWHFTEDHVERPRYKTIGPLTSIGAPGFEQAYAPRPRTLWRLGCAEGRKGSVQTKDLQGPEQCRQSDTQYPAWDGLSIQHRLVLKKRGAEAMLRAS
jgi:hypothetical protein